MQKDFIDGALGTPEAQKIVPLVAETIHQMADPNTAIIFTKDTHGPTQLDYLNSLEGKNLPVPHCIRNTAGWEIAEELKPYTEGSQPVDKPTFGSVDLCSALQIVNEKLWYTTKNGLFYCDLDGENTVKVTGKKMKDAYVVGDKVYYRDAEDENTEHAYSLLTEVDTRVTEEAVSSFFLGSKGNGYYIAERDVKPEEPEEDEESAKEETTAKAEDEKSSEETTAADGEEAAEEEPETAWTLIRVSLKDGKTTELTTVREGTALVGIGGKVYYVSDEHQGQIYSISKSGGTPKRVTRDEDCKYLMTFHDMILYYDYDDETEEGLEHIYISTPDGFMKSDILG
jgi:hypothetical protein